MSELGTLDTKGEAGQTINRKNAPKIPARKHFFPMTLPLFMHHAMVEFPKLNLVIPQEVGIDGGLQDARQICPSPLTSIWKFGHLLSTLPGWGPGKEIKTSEPCEFP